VGYDYVTVGHVTADLLDDGLRQPGGGAFYSALQAARLGLRTLIVTRGVPRELQELLGPYRDELDVEILPAERTTTLLTSDGDTQSTGAHNPDALGELPVRRQRLLAWAGPIDESVAVDTSILHLAPVARETPRAWQGRADFVGLTPQGLVREWDASGEIAPAPLRRERLPEHWDAAVFSATELPDCRELIEVAAVSLAGGEIGHRTNSERLTSPGRIVASEGGATDTSNHLVAVTAGAEPITLHLAGEEPLRVSVAPIASPRDDLGAGDVFAAALFVALGEGRPPVDAAAYAIAAAAVRIAGVGPGAVGDRRAVEARLAASTGG
jgi:1D-myo-inositol 3-kinase